MRKHSGRSKFVSLTLVVLAGWLAYGLVATAAPGVMRYQGRLTNVAGHPITGPTSVTFTFYDAESGGNQLGSFSDTKVVTPNPDGIYTTLIGDPAGVQIPAALFATQPVYLNVSVGGENLAPRMLVTSSAYALDAQALGGQDAAQYQVGTQTFTTGENITAGDLVSMDPTGLIYKVSNPGIYLSADAFGSDAEGISATLVDTDRVLIAYRDGNNDLGTAVVATISGTTITFGSPVVFETEGEAWRTSVASFDSNRVLIAYTSDVARVVAGTVSGDTVTFGAPVEVESSGVDAVAAAGLDASAGAVAYNYNHSEARMRAATVSGNVVTLGDVVSVASLDATTIGATCVGADKVLVLYGNASDGDDTARVGIYAGGVLNFGAPVVFETRGLETVSAVQLGPDSAAIAWQIPYAPGWCSVISVSGDVPTFGPGNNVTGYHTGESSVARMAANEAFVAYRPDGGTWTGGNAALIDSLVPRFEGEFALSDTMTQASAVGLSGGRVFVAYNAGPSGMGMVVQNMFAGDYRYIGVAEQTVGTGADCIVTTSGGITRQFSNLTPGAFYYISNGQMGLDGTYITAGRAYSANRFLVDYQW